MTKAEQVEKFDKLLEDMDRLSSGVSCHGLATKLRTTASELHRDYMAKLKGQAWDEYQRTKGKA